MVGRGSQALLLLRAVREQNAKQERPENVVPYRAADEFLTEPGCARLRVLFVSTPQYIEYQLPTAYVNCTACEPNP